MESEQPWKNVLAIIHNVFQMALIVWLKGYVPHTLLKLLVIQEDQMGHVLMMRQLKPVN